MNNLLKAGGWSLYKYYLNKNDEIDLLFTCSNVYDIAFGSFINTGWIVGDKFFGSKYMNSSPSVGDTESGAFIIENHGMSELSMSLHERENTDGKTLKIK